MSSCRGKDISRSSCAQIFVAEALHDLEVFVQPGDHQNLLENLRRLRQCVKLPVMDAAGHQKIARTFRSRAREHGRFHFEKSHLVHHLANFENDLVAQRQIPVRLRTPQIQIPEAQPRLFRRVDFVFDRERRRLGVVENMQLRRNQLDFPAGQFRVRFLPFENFAFHGDHEFAARLLGFRVRRGLRLFVEDHLHDAGAIAHIKKKQIAEVAPPRHPTHHDRVAAFVRDPQFPAVVCALQISQKIQQVILS
jgi:hypothetical protein